MNYKQVEELIDQGRLGSEMIQDIVSDVLVGYKYNRYNKDAQRVLKKIVIDMGATDINLMIREEEDDGYVVFRMLQRIFTLLFMTAPHNELWPCILNLLDHQPHSSNSLELDGYMFGSNIYTRLLTHMVTHRGITEVRFIGCCFDDIDLNELEFLAPRLSHVEFEDCDMCDSILINTFKNVAGKLIIDGREIPRICETFVQSQKEQLAQCTNVYCAVCMESVEKVHACMLPCGHVFCSTCVLRARTWECFVCKVPYTHCALKFF